MARPTTSRAAATATAGTKLAAIAPDSNNANAATKNPRKRRQSSPGSTAAATAAPSLGTLAFDDTGVAELEADVLAGSSGDDSETEAFPELDLDASASEGEDLADDESFDGEYDSDDIEDELDDEAQLRAELENEQNEILSGSSDDDDDDDTSDLDELIRRNTVKPDEHEPEISSIPGQNRALGERGLAADDDDAYKGLQRDFMKRSRTVKSGLTGKEKTVWDEEIEPDYASDSSTEEVRHASDLHAQDEELTERWWQHRRRTGSATFRSIGTTICRTSGTTLTGRRSCGPRPATSSTAS